MQVRCGATIGAITGIGLRELRSGGRTSRPEVSVSGTILRVTM